MKNPKTSFYGDKQTADYQALLQDQSRDYSLCLKDLIYSLYLFRLENKTYPKNHGLYWPISPPMKDQKFYMDDLDKDDNLEETNEVDPLVNAFNVYMRRRVYQKIHNDGLEPIIDFDPHAGSFAVDLALKVRSMLTFEYNQGSRVTWDQLKISNKAVIDKMNRLFPPNPEDSGKLAQKLESQITRQNNRRNLELLIGSEPRAVTDFEVTPLEELLFGDAVTKKPVRKTKHRIKPKQEVERVVREVSKDETITEQTSAQPQTTAEVVDREEAEEEAEEEEEEAHEQAAKETGSTSSPNLGSRSDSESEVSNNSVTPSPPPNPNGLPPMPESVRRLLASSQAVDPSRPLPPLPASVKALMESANDIQPPS